MSYGTWLCKELSWVAKKMFRCWQVFPLSLLFCRFSPLRIYSAEYFIIQSEYFLITKLFPIPRLCSSTNFIRLWWFFAEVSGWTHFFHFFTKQGFESRKIIWIWTGWMLNQLKILQLTQKPLKNATLERMSIKSINWHSPNPRAVVKSRNIWSDFFNWIIPDFIFFPRPLSFGSL